MSSIDRLTNLARGVISDSQKRFDENGGLPGAARRVGTRVRDAAETARSAVSEGWTGLVEGEDDPETDGLVDPAREAARHEVDNLRASSPVRSTAGAAAPSTETDLSRALAQLDRRLRDGSLDRASWEQERARLLDDLDRAASHRTPRRRTL